MDSVRIHRQFLGETKPSKHLFWPSEQPRTSLQVRLSECARFVVLPTRFEKVMYVRSRTLISYFVCFITLFLQGFTTPYLVNSIVAMDQDRITKKVRQGEVNVDYDESTLVVNYEIEKVAVDVNGRVLQVISSKQECKRIKIKQLAADKNIAQLSNDIVEKCSYIHPSRTEEVEQLLIRLRKHQQQIAAPSNNDNGRGDRDRDRQRERGGGPGPSERDERERSSRDSGREERRVKERSDRNDNRNDASVRSSQKEDDMVRRRRQQEREREDVLPPANIDDIDEYLDMLYQVSGKSEEQKAECTRIQVRGTGMILLLCRDVLNLETLIQNSTVMGALTRVLAEEYKKSTELTFNILRIFLSFSNFSEMHGLMANYKVGMLTMKAIEYEVKRFAHRAEEKEEREARYAAIVERAAGKFGFAGVIGVITLYCWCLVSCGVVH